MSPLPQCAFTAYPPFLSFSSSFLPPAKCVRRPHHAKSRTPPPSRSPPQARTRRGAIPEPIIRETLFEVEAMKDVDLNPVDFSRFKGKVVFAVNVASEDNYTDSMYTFLANLLGKYQHEGFEVLAFPCNWYGQKETGSHEQIKNFVHTKYSDKITVMAKANPEWNEVFALAQAHFPGEIIWNFHGKFLFDRSGMPVERFDLLTEDSTVEQAVCRALAGITKKGHRRSSKKETPGSDGNVATADQIASAEDEDDYEDDKDDTDGPELSEVEEGLAVEAQ